jgi:hypothetical protein
MSNVQTFGGYQVAINSKTAGNSIAALVLTLLFSANIAFADSKFYSGAETAPNIAEIFVLDDGIAVHLEIFPGDLNHFRDLLPDRMLRRVPVDRPGQAERLYRFSKEGLVLQDPQNSFLVAELKRLDLRERKSRYSPNAGLFNPTTGQRNPQPPADPRVVYVELFYPYINGRPDVLEISPPLDDKGVPVATIGFLAYHQSVTVNDFRYLAYPEQLKLNWKDSWYSKFDNPALRRYYSDAMMSFLYIEPRQIRHEMLLRVRDLENWVALDLGNGEAISVEAQERLKQQISEFVSNKNPLRVNGELTRPNDISVVFVAIEPKGISVIDDERQLDLQTAMVGVILASEIEAMPQEVSVEWELFTRNQSRVFTNTIDPAGPFNGFVEPDDPIIRWQNHLKTYEEPEINPVQLDPEHNLRIPALTLTLLLTSLLAGVFVVRASRPSWIAKSAVLAVLLVLTVGSFNLGWVSIWNPFAAIPDKSAAPAIAGELVGNLHAALAETEPTARANSLLASVSEPKLAEIGRELERGLVIELQGGSLATVDSIDDLELSNMRPLSGSRGFQATTRWTVEASGNHWGHPHRKAVRFTALMDIEPVGGSWKLTGITVTNAQVES